MNPTPTALTQAQPGSEGSLFDRIPDLGADVAVEPFLHESFWTVGNMLILLVLILLLAGLSYWLYRHLRPSKKTPPPSAEQMALASLHELEAQHPDARRLSLELSLLLREYITKETQEPTLYETHQELSSRLDSLASIPAQYQYELRSLLEELAEMKYAGTPLPSDELSSTKQSLSPYERARTLIIGIAEAERKQALAAAKEQNSPTAKKERRPRR